MERVCEELDEAKAEIEKLRAEYKIKVELSESLKRAHNEQLIKIQEANAKIEKQAQELIKKDDEISIMKQKYEDSKSSMKEKEAIIKHLSFANEKLRVSCDEKLRKWEEGNRELALALDEANSKNMDQEQKLNGYKEEIKGLKSLLSASEKKCLEAEKKAKVSKELRQRDDMLLKLEEENRKVEDQLKWKKEQFKHLEEAHEKLRAQFQANKKEWEQEKSTLLDEISTLQTNLDSQTRISGGLQSQLQMCNQALAHEESRRMCLEIQLCETKICLDDVFGECQEAKSNIEHLSDPRDKDIASLRDLLGTKETLYKELEYQVRRLEQENRELRLSLKELQEAQIQGAGTSSSLPKLRNKLKGLEQVHRDCSKNLRAKEAKWNYELDKMAGDLSNCRSELEIKDSVIKELKMELEGCGSLMMQLELQNEETSLMLLVLKSGVLEARSKLANEKSDLDLKNSEVEENVSLLKEQLELKSAALVKAETNIEDEHQKMASLLGNVESLSLIEQQQLQLQKELDRHKEMLRESSGHQLQLKNQALRMESDLGKVADALDRANEELAEKFCEGNELEFELQIWKSIADQLKANLENNQQMRKQVEFSLLEEVEVEVTLKQEKESLAQALEDRDRRIDDLQQRLLLLDQKLEIRETETAKLASTEIAMAHDLEKETTVQNSKEKEKISDGLQKEIEWLEPEWVRREPEGAVLAHINAERTYEHEKDNFYQLLEERDQRIDYFHRLFMSLEEKFKSSTASFSSQLAEKQAEINLLHEAWEKITTDEVLKEIEIQQKRFLIVELEDDLSNLQKKLELQVKTLSSSKEESEKIAAELKAKQLEIKKLTSDLRTSATVIDKLESEKRTLLEDVKKLLSDKESLLRFIGSQSESISKFSVEDMKLIGIWERIVQKFDDNGIGTDLKVDDDLYDPLKENTNIHPTSTTKRVEAILDERSSLKALNN